MDISFLIITNLIEQWYIRSLLLLVPPDTNPYWRIWWAIFASQGSGNCVANNLCIV